MLNRWNVRDMVGITVEPPIKDPPRKGQPLYKGHFQYPQKCICNNYIFNFRKEKQPPLQETKLLVPKCPLL